MGQNTDVWRATAWNIHACEPFPVFRLSSDSYLHKRGLNGPANGQWRHPEKEKEKEEEKLINTLMNIDSFMNKIVNSHALPLPGGFFSVNYLRTGLQALAIFNHE